MPPLVQRKTMQVLTRQHEEVMYALHALRAVPDAQPETHTRLVGLLGVLIGVCLIAVVSWLTGP